MMPKEVPWKCTRSLRCTLEQQRMTRMGVHTWV